MIVHGSCHSEEVLLGKSTLGCWNGCSLVLDLLLPTSHVTNGYSFKPILTSRRK